MAKPVRCHYCHTTVDHADLIDGLFCSTSCRDAHALQHQAIRQQLTDAGFTPHEIPNVWIKDGAAVTEDEVIAHGIDETLAAHLRASSGR